MTSYMSAYANRYMFARMLKLKARDSDKIVLLHGVVDGFQPFLESAGGGFGASDFDRAEKRAKIG